jgi:hypothetical protein
MGKVGDTIVVRGEKASFCYKVPRLLPLVLLIRAV